MDAQTRNPGRIVKLAVGLLVALLVFAALKVGVPWVQRQTMSASSFEQQALADPSMGPLFAAMKETYPQEFARYIGEMSTSVKAGEPMEAIRARSFGELRAFSVSKMPMIAHAPEAALVTVAETQRGVVSALARQDPALCAQFGSTGLRPDAKPDAPSLSAIGRAGVALLRAAKAGETAPVARSMVSDPVKLAAFVARLRADGMTAEQFAMVGSSATLMASPIATQCDITTRLYNTVAELPAPEKAWMIAFIMTEAVKATPPM